jgi:hypothetical protein
LVSAALVAVIVTEPLLEVAVKVEPEIVPPPLAV